MAADGGAAGACAYGRNSDMRNRRRVQIISATSTMWLHWTASSFMSDRGGRAWWVGLTPPPATINAHSCVAYDVTHSSCCSIWSRSYTSDGVGEDTTGNYTSLPTVINMIHVWKVTVTFSQFYCSIGSAVCWSCTLLFCCLHCDCLGLAAIKWFLTAFETLNLLTYLLTYLTSTT